MKSNVFETVGTRFYYCGDFYKVVAVQSFPACASVLVAWVEKNAIPGACGYFFAAELSKWAAAGVVCVID